MHPEFSTNVSPGRRSHHYSRADAISDKVGVREKPVGELYTALSTIAPPVWRLKMNRGSTQDELVKEVTNRMLTDSLHPNSKIRPPAAFVVTACASLAKDGPYWWRDPENQPPNWRWSRRKAFGQSCRPGKQWPGYHTRWRHISLQWCRKWCTGTSKGSS